MRLDTVSPEIARNSNKFKCLEEEEINIPTPEPPEPPVEQRRYPVKENRRPPLRLNNQYEH